MKVTSRLDFGAIKFEIEAEESEDYQNQIHQIVEFIEENKSDFSELSGFNPSPGVDVSESPTPHPDGDNTVETASIDTNTPIGEIANRLRLNPDLLDDILIIDDEQGYPMLYLNDHTELLGGRKTDRQRNASLILLYVWDEYYSEERVKSSDLKDALQMSSISDSNMGNMYQGKGDNLFSRGGRGPTATVALTPPGKREARKVLRNLVEDYADAEEEEG